MQLTLRDIEIQGKQVKTKALAAELDRRLKAVAHGIDRNELAAINNYSYSYICDILNTNNEDAQKSFKTWMIPSLIIEKPDLFKTEIIDFLCALCNYQSPEKKKALTAEEELAQIRKVIKQHGLESIFEKPK